MTLFGKLLTILPALLSRPDLIRAEETATAPKKTIEFLSPDGKCAFRYTGESEEDKRTYELMEKASAKS